MDNVHTALQLASCRTYPSIDVNNIVADAGAVVNVVFVVSVVFDITKVSGVSAVGSPPRSLF